MKRRNIAAGILAVALAAGLTACSSARDGSGQSSAAETTAVLAIIEDNQIPLYEKPESSNVRQPQASGTVVYDNGKVLLDASNSSQGYVMVKYSGSNSKIKVQITKSGKETYTYDLNARNDYEVFPLSEGNGSYSVKVFENLTGNQYSQAFSQDISVTITDEFAPFLYPNQYVNFNSGSTVVQTGSQIAAGISDPIEVVTAIYNYVITNLTYDTAKASSVKSGYLPNVDTVLAQKTGICFDYAAVMTAMLRSQNIPTKLVVGYTGSVYHAWVNVYIDNVGWVDGMIFFDGHDWQLMDPTFASSAKQSKEIMEYIGNASNYQAKFLY
ncbi:transglutaminase domain-containing protein [Clostridium sp. MCC353]|uniref:transglutaminase-like domain-containing protein n=1 Tax=Clostridium sp. MCC353 TaxID=2592646 RepID=UPI001C01DA75|nr:transglutaminase-like domain-containing protein [Clostridium sp. MCC353]MBT9777551.1 transglutaminase domain-containing protein [Clostridium sp. MCC353]